MVRTALNVVVALALLATAAPAFALGPATTLESRDSTGARVGGRLPSVSADGRYIVFTSTRDFVPGDTNGQNDLFLRDRVTGQTRAIDVGPNGKTVGLSLSAGAEISANGRYVAFPHTAPPLMGIGDDRVDLIVWDRVTGAFRRFPDPTDQSVSQVSIDAAGDRIAFSTSEHVYLADAVTGAVTLLSATPGGTPGNDGSGDPAISADGRWVAFDSFATNLVNDSTAGRSEVLVRNVATGEITRASVGAGNTKADASSSDPSISGNGCVVAFDSDATNLVANDAGTKPKVFARDRCDGTTERVSITNALMNNQRDGEDPDISDDGCQVAFWSSTTYPSPPAPPAAVLRDRCAGITSRLDLSTGGDPGGGVDLPVRLSGGSARYATFPSFSTTLVNGDDPGGEMDVFLRDRADRDVPPVAVLTVARDGRNVTADATASHDPDGPTITGSIAFGDGSPARDGLIATHEYDRTGTFSVTATIRDADGVTATQTQIVTIADAGPFGPPAPGPSVLATPLPSTPGGTTRRSAGQVLRGISLSRRSFRVAPRRGKPKDGQGTTLTVRLGAAATVGLRFDRMLKGRRRNGKCSARAKKGKRCTLFRQAGTLRRRLKAGSSTVTLTGRIGSRRLPVGRYRLTVTAASERRSLTLTVLKAAR